jgi:hypothetical protein
MFTITKVQADAIRAEFAHAGEFSAAVELRRIFPAITSNAEARRHARRIAGRPSLPPRPVCVVTHLRPESTTDLP